MLVNTPPRTRPLRSALEGLFSPQAQVTSRSVSGGRLVSLSQRSALALWHKGSPGDSVNKGHGCSMKLYVGHRNVHFRSCLCVVKCCSSS